VRTETPFHCPVMVQECLEFLQPREGGVYLDCTLGEGGHALAILEKTAGKASVIGMDLDGDALESARQRLKTYIDQVQLVHENFARIGEVLARLGVNTVDGLLCDLGVSSRQLDQGERGFSFQVDGPLDMRMNRNGNLTAADILNRWKEEELEAIFERGEVPGAHRLAKAVVGQRRSSPFRTTGDLVRFLDKNGLHNRRTFHPATLAFQALRLATNREPENLSMLLSQLPAVLSGAGRCVFLSYHSLEDRAIKRALRERELDGTLRLLVKKPLCPRPDEIRLNPRARSAKMRAAERVSAG
jgi:16S rRNA (cytosine1402-N4)-methyltransferase